MDDKTPPPISNGVSERADVRSITQNLELSLAASPDAPGRARDELTAWLGHDLSYGTLVDDARLLVSELVTNSIRHARITPDQPLRLTASLDAATLRLELHDDGTDGTVASRTPQKHDGAGGFGLDLATRLSRAWGVERDAHGTTVWLELAAGTDA